MSNTENREKCSIFRDWSQKNVFFGIFLIYPVSMFMFVFMFVVVYGFELLVRVRLVSIVFGVLVVVVDFLHRFTRFHLVFLFVCIISLKDT